ncbi:Myb-like DNA-binding protein [Phytophthora megakarya]|uniref:Myb-like DNA-binding protein n=1 Tax=Phytophthora megakarya TaxID=4795 RepID=A0A225UKA2_9STRA|nr:Myb-like DNA-binding protein [Phytophthora megakarya]
MTITHSVQQEFLDEETKNLICIPCYPNLSSVHNSPLAASVRLRVSAVSHSLPSTPLALLHTPLPTPPRSSSPIRTAESTKGERWTEDEHERFLLGMELFKAGPWKKIASVVGTRDARQTMSHAQKYRQKIKRRKLGLPTPEYPQHDTNSVASAKRMRTEIVVETPNGSEAADRVVGSTRSNVSPRGQLPREALGGELGATGPISMETVHTAANDVRALDGVMVGGDTASVDRLNPREAALEPLEIVNAAAAQDSWLGPDELWDFLDGRPASGADVVGACSEADP